MDIWCFQMMLGMFFLLVIHTLYNVDYRSNLLTVPNKKQIYIKLNTSIMEKSKYTHILVHT